MKLAILLIGLIGLSISQTPQPTPAPWVSPTTTLALSYKTKSATAKATAATNLQNAQTALTTAQTTRTNAEVGATMWNNWKTAQDLVTSNAGLLKTQDSALALLVKTAAAKAQDVQTAKVQNQCQVMGAAMRVNWQTLAQTTTAMQNDLTPLLNAYVVPTAAYLTSTQSALTSAAGKVMTDISTNKVKDTTIPSSVANSDRTKPKDYEAWDLVGTTGSYLSLQCPNQASFICSDCTNKITPFVTAKLLKSTCGWDSMLTWYFSMDQMMKKLKTLEGAKGQYAVYTTVLADLAAVTLAQTNFIQKFSDVTANMQNLQAQVDKMAITLLQMQQMSKLAQTNLVLQKVLTAAAVTAANAAKTTADDAITTASGKLTDLQNTDTAAQGAVAAQVTAVNNTMTAVMTDMTALSVACAATQTDNAALQAAVMAQGVAHELTTSSKASDALAVALVKSLNDQTKVSKTDYDNVVKMKAASGSSIVKSTLFSLIALIFAYYHK